MLVLTLPALHVNSTCPTLAFGVTLVILRYRKLYLIVTFPARLRYLVPFSMHTELPFEINF